MDETELPRSRAHLVTNSRGRDTGPEMLLRRELHARGLRYRVDGPSPDMRRRRVDLAFTGAGVGQCGRMFLARMFLARVFEARGMPKVNTTYWAGEDRDEPGTRRRGERTQTRSG